MSSYLYMLHACCVHNQPSRTQTTNLTPSPLAPFSTWSLWQGVRRPYKIQRFRHFLPFNQGPVNTNFMKQKRCFFTVWPNAHFKDNPSLIQAPLPALNPFRWILKIPGFTAIKYSSMTQKTALTFYVTSPVHPTSSQFNPLFTAECSSGSSHSLSNFTKRRDTWRTEQADRPVLNHSSATLWAHDSKSWIQTVPRPSIRHAVAQY
jgi:hypothetical protein